jgi:hypothetical protein
MKQHHYQEAAKHFSIATKHLLSAHEAMQTNDVESVALHAYTATSHIKHASDLSDEAAGLFAEMMNNWDPGMRRARMKSTATEDGEDMLRDEYEDPAEKALKQQRPI